MIPFRYYIYICFDFQVEMDPHLPGYSKASSDHVSQAPHIPAGEMLEYSTNANNLFCNKKQRFHRGG